MCRADYPPPPPPQSPYGTMQGLQMPSMGGGTHVPDDGGTPCPSCGKDTKTITRKKIGCVAIIWAIVLSSCMCCCIPCVTDGWKDTEMLCIKCQTVKGEVAARCL